MQANNYNTLSASYSPNILSFGFRLQDSKTPFYSQISLYKNIPNVNKKQGSTIYQYSISFDCFYNMSKNIQWKLSPLIGMNFNNYYLSAVSKNTLSILSNKLLEESFVRNNIFRLKTGISIDREFFLMKNNFILGLEFFYNIDLSNKTWYNNSNMKLESLPGNNFSGFGFNILGGLLL